MTVAGIYGALVCARQGHVQAHLPARQRRGVGTVTHFKARKLRLGEAEGLNLLSLPKRTVYVGMRRLSVG